MPLAVTAAMEAEILALPVGLDVNAAADAWASVFINYLSTAVIPPGLGGIASAARAQAVAAFVAAAVPIPGRDDGLLYLPAGSSATVFPVMLTALVAQAATIPAVTVPPASPFVTPAAPSDQPASTNAAAFAAAVAAWAVTGTHVVPGAPPPPPVPWS